MDSPRIEMDEQCERACRLAVCKYEAFFRNINSVDFDDLMQEARMSGFIALQGFDKNLGHNKAGLVYIAAIYRMNKLTAHYKTIKRCGIKLEVEFLTETSEVIQEDSYEELFMDTIDTIILEVYRAGGIAAYSRASGLSRNRVSKMYHDAIRKCSEAWGL